MSDRYFLFQFSKEIYCSPNVSACRIPGHVVQHGKIPVARRSLNWKPVLDLCAAEKLLWCGCLVTSLQRGKKLGSTE